MVKQYRPHVLAIFAVGLVCLTGLHSILENALADMRFDWLARSASGKVVVVAIDSRSIEAIGTWPWSRTLHAKLIDNLERAGASDIAFDVDFSSPSNKTADEAFSTSLKKAGGSIILPAFQQPIIRGDGTKGTLINEPIKQFRDNAWTALVNVAPDQDGIVRRYPFADNLKGNLLPSMATMLAGNSRFRPGSFWIDFSINPDAIPTVSYIDVLNGKPSVLSQVRDKKVIVGGTALELGDRFNIPGGRIIPGPRLQALAAESILQKREMQRISGPFAFAEVGLLILSILLLFQHFSPTGRVVFLLGLSVAAEAGAALLQAKSNFILDTSLLHTATATYLVAVVLEEIDFRGILRKIAENRFERIAMSLGDALICVDRNGIATICNPSAASVFRYSQNELIGRRIDNLFFENEAHQAFSLLTCPKDELQSTGGKVTELIGRRKNGETFPVDACLSAWQGSDGWNYGVVFRDISVRKQEEEKVRFLAEFDSLTGLANRYTLRHYLEIELAKARSTHGQLALLLIDLDTFKEINDTLGHAHGDKVLVAVGKRLQAVVSDCGLIARLGGDEFAIVVPGYRAAERAWTLCERVAEGLRRESIIIEGRPLSVKGSIGVALFPDDGIGVEQLLGNADLALYRAKAEVPGRYVFFDQKFRNELESRLSLEMELGRAIQNGEFELFYQPKVDLANNNVVGTEALIRWRHPVRGLVPPVEFMPVINASLLAGDIGCWVLEAACAQGAIWERKGYNVPIAVNLSPSQIRSGDLSVVVSAILQEKGFSPSHLELEVTEDIVIENEKVAIRNFVELQELGVRLAFDDFGTGYAGLSYLKKFPLDVLKIDRSFVAGMVNSADDRAIVGATIAMSRQLGLSVVAEGIENSLTVDLLRSFGCQQGQGYLFGQPMPAAEFEKRFLEKSRGVHRPAERASAA
jgi:diguanylate cyclase (GGDEF)-like protein/PAS domain S-box-containing protein